MRLSIIIMGINFFKRKLIKFMEKKRLDVEVKEVEITNLTIDIQELNSEIYLAKGLHTNLSAPVQPPAPVEVEDDEVKPIEL